MIKLRKWFKNFDNDFYVAVSGGIDSIVLAHLLCRLHKKRIKICHFNHNLRPQNNEMEQSVRSFCEDLGVDYDMEIRTGELKNTSEDFLRSERLKYFQSLHSNIVLGHHLDDAVESYVMNMLTGRPEYVPIPEKTYLNVGESEHEDNFILRPAITNRKESFISYAKNNDLMKYVVEDETNQNNNYRRNWIRNEIIPKFEGFGLPKIVKKKFYP